MAVKRSKSRLRRALTLLELILALSLTVLVLMTIGMAIDMHFRMLDVRRTNVEEAVEIRSILNIISKDVGGVMLYVPPDTSGLDAVTGNSATAAANLAEVAAADPNAAAAAISGLAASAGGSGGGQPAGGTSQVASQTITGGGSNSTASTKTGGGSGGGPGGGPGGGGGAGGAFAAASGGAAPASSGSSTDPAAATEATAAAPASMVGLRGTATELKFEISRLPRVDQYDPQYAAGGEVAATDIPSDVKTVVYFLADEGMPPDAKVIGPQDVLPSATGMGKGLMRRELDRAVNSYAESNGDTTSIYSGARLVSDKVVGIQFQYFDGSAWLPEWDSDASGGLPRAVEIVLTVQPTFGMTEEEIAELAPDQVPPVRTYRQVMKIPTASLAPPATTEATTETGTAAPASGTPSTQGATP